MSWSLKSAENTAGTVARPVSHGRVSKDRLFEHAARAVRTCLSQTAESPERKTVLGKNTLMLLDFLLDDDSATPQIFVDPEDAGIYVEWLVDGRSLTLMVETDSTFSVTADDSDESELTYESRIGGWLSPDERLRKVREHLALISENVRHRLVIDDVPVQHSRALI